MLFFRLYNKIKESGELTKYENETFKNIVQPICNAFPGEHLISDFVVPIRDSVVSISSFTIIVQIIFSYCCFYIKMTLCI